MAQMTALQKISRKSSDHHLAVKLAEDGRSYSDYVACYYSTRCLPTWISFEEYSLIERLLRYKKKEYYDEQI